MDLFIRIQEKIEKDGFICPDTTHVCHTRKMICVVFVDTRRSLTHYVHSSHRRFRLHSFVDCLPVQLVQSFFLFQGSSKITYQSLSTLFCVDVQTEKVDTSPNEAMLTGQTDLQVKKAIDSNQYPVGQSLDIDVQLYKMSVDSSFNKNPVSV